MMAPCCSGRGAMRNDSILKPLIVARALAVAMLLAGFLPASPVSAAQAITTDLSAEPPPPEAEAANQDLTGTKSADNRLDEAIFTEISPLTIPEIGIALPPDQEG